MSGVLDAGFFEQIEHAIVKSRCFLPDGEFFELGIFGHAVFLLSIGSGRQLAIGYRLLAIGYWLLRSHPRLYAPPAFFGKRKRERAGLTGAKPAHSGGTNDTR